jgi:hypothetical protein
MSATEYSRILMVAGALLIALAITALALGKRGGSERGAGDLAWAKDPRVFTPQRLPRDRVLTARLRNDSLRKIRLRAEDLRLEDAAGREVRATVVFLESFMHGLYPPTRQPAQVAEAELRRTGRLAVMEAGASVPLTVAWRREAGASPPTRLDYGVGYLPVPPG